MQIRKLKYGDCLTVAKLIKKLVEKVGANADLLNLISADVKAGTGSSEGEQGTAKNDVYVRVGTKIVTLLVEYLEQDVNAWFASLAGVEVETLLEMPFDTPMLIIEQLMQSEEAANFFTTALRLYKKMKGSGSRFQMLLTE